VRHKSLEDEPRSGRPSDVVCDCSAVENIVMQNHRVNVHLIADTVGISTVLVRTILRERLLMTEVCARCKIPQMLDEKMKQCRYEVSSENLKLMQLDWNLFVECIVNADETWIHHYDPESKQESM